MHQQQTVFENIAGKGEIARNEQFLLFPQCFLLNQIIVFPFVHIFDIISLFAAEFEEPKIGRGGKGLSNQTFISVEIENIEDDKIKCNSKYAIQIWKSRKHCGKGRKCRLTASSPFRTML